jgi:hypothetical protein
MLALSDTQDLASLLFDPEVDRECAGRILERVKAVKRHPASFVCLLTDMFTTCHCDLRPREQVLILEVVKQAMDFMDDESTSFLRPLASWLRDTEQRMLKHWDFLPGDRDRAAVETQRICGRLQAKSAASLISSTAQLQLVSCTRSVEVAQPAMGRLRIHESL